MVASTTAGTTSTTSAAENNTSPNAEGSETISSGFSYSSTRAGLFGSDMPRGPPVPSVTPPMVNSCKMLERMARLTISAKASVTMAR